MLNPFPDLLSYSFFAPTLVRMAAALIFFHLAYYHSQNKDSLATVSFPVVGAGAWIPLLIACAETIVGAGLFFGYVTQISAAVGAAIALKYFVWNTKFPQFFVLSRAATLLLFAMCVSLALSGAGAVAFDLPL